MRPPHAVGSQCPVQNLAPQPAGGARNYPCRASNQGSCRDVSRDGPGLLLWPRERGPGLGGGSRMGWASHPTVFLLWFNPRVTCCHPASALPKLAMALGLSFPSLDGLCCPCPLGQGGSLAPPRAAPQLWQSLGRRGSLASPPRPPAQAAPPLTHPAHRGVRTLVPKQTQPTEAPHHPWETPELLGLAFQLSRALASL